jgi:hypothetical protein
MMTSTLLAPAPSDPPEPFTDQVRLAVAADLARFKGSSREHTESDLRCYLAWCAERSLDPLAARRPHLEPGRTTPKGRSDAGTTLRLRTRPVPLAPPGAGGTQAEGAPSQ